jgi:hypothetical protein
LTAVGTKIFKRVVFASLVGHKGCFLHPEERLCFLPNR